MADIFLSYSRADRPLAQSIATALEAEGLSVWWDKVLRAGQTYDEVTESMLRDSNVVVVLWSQTSVKSKWVRAEATLGQRSSEVVPAMIEEADRPIMFELTQTADLIGWDGDRNDPRWGDFVADIKRALDKHQTAAAPPTQTASETNSAPTSAPASAQGDATIETVFWTSIKDGSDPADFEAYLKRYPEGHYGDLARNRLTVYSQDPVAAPPPQPDPKPAPEPVRAPEPEPQPEPKPEPAPVPPSSTAQAPAKKSGAPLPFILAGLAAIGVGGWFGVQTFLSADEPAPSDQAAPLIEPLSCDLCPPMVTIAGGTFTMGSPDDEPNRSGNEGPLREVALRPFLMSQSEITADQWQICVDAGACRAAQGSGGAAITGVSFDDAQAYTAWLSEVSGRPHRLPSEAQWEYAARAGTQTPYWWGSTYPGPGVTSASGSDAASLSENPFGLTGMLGNVREWVADCYVNSYANARSDGRPVGGSSCNRPVVRGGSWKDGATEHRAANRARFSRSVRDRSLGFRVVAEAPES